VKNAGGTPALRKSRSEDRPLRRTGGRTPAGRQRYEGAGLKTGHYDGPEEERRRDASATKAE